MKTQHKTECKRVFKHYDLSCPRCQELQAGQPARAGWNDFTRRQDAIRLEAIRTHDYAACAAKNIVCTCFEW